MCRCLFPVKIKNPNYCPDSMFSFRRERFLDVPCGKCTNCRSNRRNEWSVRLKHALLEYGHAYFITLTYRDEDLPHDENGLPCFRYKDCQDFFKRLRKKYSSDNIKLQYFIVAEYGDNYYRPHYHLILFGLPKYEVVPTYVWRKGKFVLRNLVPELNEIIRSTWGHGRTDVGYCDFNCIGYLVSYCFKPSQRFSGESCERMKQFHKCSTKPFLGYYWHIKHFNNYVRFKFRWKDGDFSFPLPRIYKRKYKSSIKDNVEDFLKRHEYSVYLDTVCKEVKQQALRREFDNAAFIRLWCNGELTDSDFYFKIRDPSFVEKHQLRNEIRSLKEKSVF